MDCFSPLSSLFSSPKLHSKETEAWSETEGENVISLFEKEKKLKKKIPRNPTAEPDIWHMTATRRSVGSDTSPLYNL